MKNRFDITEEEAKEIFNKYKNLDPFPNIQPALLNSADILDYVAETGMIFPFDEANIKSASYEIPFLGNVIGWDEEGKKYSEKIQIGKEFILKHNSIAFVTPQTIFSIPNYIALRFNLRITHVHRGLLLGTGPLIDPGYEGKLLIPLHNLTNNDYKLIGGEGLIWMEFTKISPNELWNKTIKEEKDARRIGNYTEFPKEKKIHDTEYFITKALKGQNRDSIPSSIPIALKKAEVSSNASRRDAQSSAKSASTMKNYGLIALLGVLLSLVLIVFTVWQSYTSFTSFVAETNTSMRNLRDGIDQKIATHEKEEALSREEIQTLKREIQTLKKELETLAGRSKQIRESTIIKGK